MESFSTDLVAWFTAIVGTVAGLFTDFKSADGKTKALYLFGFMAAIVLVLLLFG